MKLKNWGSIFKSENQPNIGKLFMQPTDDGNSDMTIKWILNS